MSDGHRHPLKRPTASTEEHTTVGDAAARDVAPSARSVRVVATGMLLVYLAPLGAAVAVAVAARLVRPTAPPAARDFLLPAAVALAAAVWSWCRPTRSRTAGPSVPEPRRTAITRAFPEFANLAIEVGTASREAAVDARRLLVGYGFIQDIGAAAIGDEAYYALAHEARHLAVGGFRLVAAFRSTRNAYLVLGATIYPAFLLNWAGLVDGPDRVALALYAALAPYLWALLRAVLDEALFAYEWRLELDADQAARARCEAEGRAIDVSLLFGPVPNLAPDGHPPWALRRGIVAGAVESGRTATAIFAAGAVIALVPLFMVAIFGSIEVAHADVLNAALGALNLASFAAAGWALVRAYRGRSVGASIGIPAPRSGRVALPRAMVGAAGRLERSGARVLGWAWLVSAIGIVAIMAAWRSMSASVLAASAALLFACAVSRRFASGRAGPATVAAYALVEFARFAFTGWFLRATVVLPIFDDMGSLGGAMREHGDLVSMEMARMLVEEQPTLVVIVAASLALSLAIAAVGLTDADTRGALRRRRRRR